MGWMNSSLQCCARNCLLSLVLLKTNGLPIKMNPNSYRSRYLNIKKTPHFPSIYTTNKVLFS